MSAQTSDAKITIIKYRVQIAAMLFAIENHVSLHVMVGNHLSEFVFTLFREEIAYDMKFDDIFLWLRIIDGHSFHQAVKTMPGMDFSHSDQVQFFRSIIDRRLYFHVVKVDAIRDADGSLPEYLLII